VAVTRPEHNDGTQPYPMADIVGTSRRLLSETATVTDTYSLDAFGRQMSASGSTVNPYRFGAAWGYTTDTPGSGLLQLGARFYWPEVGRFIQQDPAGDGMNWYAYAGNNPVAWVDPTGYGGVWIGGVHLGDDKPWLVFDAGSIDQLGMSAAATASGVITGASLGMLRPDWRNPCDQWGSLSRNIGIGSGVLLAAAATNPAAARGSFQPFWRYVDSAEEAAIRAGGSPGRWMVRGPVPPYAIDDAAEALNIGHDVASVVPVKVPWWQPVAGPRPVEGGWPGALEWYRGWGFPKG
jgi:RHS repeat-associated protein